MICRKINYGSIRQCRTIRCNFERYFNQFLGIMSSNIRIKKVCEHCEEIFTAKTTRTRFCSHRCNAAAYKKKAKEDKIEHSNQQTKEQILNLAGPSTQPEIKVSKELVNVKELSVITSLSERTLFRLIKDKNFPKMKIGKRLVFNKDSVINYLSYKYGSV